jgi:hypothetical protein
MIQEIDIFGRMIFTVLGALFVALLLWWFYRISTLVNAFLGYALEVTGAQFVQGLRIPPFYRKIEITGNYKGRDVNCGVVFAGFKNEFLPLPHIEMRLKDTVGYNMNRLPNYAVIEKNLLIYKVRLSVLWGVFDKSYLLVFGKSYFVIALEKLLATAEDVERGRSTRMFLNR